MKKFKDHINEASYAGNIGIMELIKFKQKATPEQKKEFDRLLADKKTQKVWELVQQVTGVKLHKSVHEEKQVPHPDILPPAGAGNDGTKTLLNRYKKDTPGQ